MLDLFKTNYFFFKKYDDVYSKLIDDLQAGPLVINEYYNQFLLTEEWRRLWRLNALFWISILAILLYNYSRDSSLLILTINIITVMSMTVSLFYSYFKFSRCMKKLEIMYERWK